MWFSGKLLRMVMTVINERMATDVAERQAASEQAAKTAADAATASSLTPPAQARRR
jgi:hypothetical protein